MKRMAWLTDIHLNFLQGEQLNQFLQVIKETEPDGIWITGDIAEGPSVASYLEEMESVLKLPLYFVLGNHDYYYGSLREVRVKMAEISKKSSHIHWLPQCGVVPLSEKTALVGHDGWADGRYGDFLNSSIYLNDYRLIQDLLFSNRRELLAKLHSLADEAAGYLKKNLEEGFQKYPHIYLLTHIPPFAEACWYQGKNEVNDWTPHFSSKVVGDALKEVMKDRRDCNLTVLCGHTHNEGRAQILSNLLVITGGAEYEKPAIQDVLEVE